MQFISRVGLSQPSMSCLHMRTEDWLHLQELMNILWAFVQYRYQPEQLLAKLNEAIQQPDLASQFKASDWASLVWGFASSGASMTPAAATAISKHSMNLLGSMNSSELCNLLW